MLNGVVVFVLGLTALYAPLAFGCTTPATQYGLDAMLALAFLLWLIGKFLDRQMPRVPLVAIGILILLLVLGGTQALNPRYEFVKEGWYFKNIEGFVPFLPWTVDQRVTLEQLIHLSALGLAFIVAADLARDWQLRWNLLQIVAISGMVVAILGMLQQATGSEILPFLPEPKRRNMGAQFFGGFYYHANASAFLNLVWPAAFALFLRAQAKEWHLRKNLWLVSFLLCFIGLLVNVSKAGHVMAGVGLVLTAVFFFQVLPPVWRQPSIPMIVVTSIVIIAAAGLFILPTLDTSTKRWESTVTSDYLTTRIQPHENVPRIAGEAGASGFGAGTFRLVYPMYALGSQQRGFLHHAHQDYLQTIIEWGWVGFALWLGLFLGGWFRSAWRHFTYHPDASIAAALVALLVVGIHAMVDFPLQIGALQFFVAIHLGIVWRGFREVRAQAEDDPKA